MTCFDCKVCFGSKFTSSAEGRRFNWLIYDSMTSLFACGRFSKSRGLSASVSSFTHSIHRPVILGSRTAQKRLLRRLCFAQFKYLIFSSSLQSPRQRELSLLRLVLQSSCKELLKTYYLSAMFTERVIHSRSCQ